MAYNNLDWIAAWYVDDYVTLTETQEKEFDNAINAFVAWHRKSELKSYILKIEDIKIDARNSIKNTNFNSYADSLKRFLQVALVEIEPEIARLAYTFTDQQVTEFLDEIEARNLKRIQKNKDESEEERLENGLERIESRIESFIGDLNKEQQQLLKETNRKLLPTFEHRIELRRAWATSIQQAYVVRNDILEFEGKHSESAKTAFRSALSSSILETDSLRTKEYIAVLDHNKAIWVITMESLIASLSKKQLEALNDKLNETIDDIEALI